MISSVRLRNPTFESAQFFLTQKCSLGKVEYCSLPNIQYPKQSMICFHKPLHISFAESFALVAKTQKRDSTRCEAYEANRSRPIEINIDLPDQQARKETAQTLRISVYFATWWALNVVFNIYNKKVLNVFPFPWLTSTLSLATGSLMMLISWAVGIVEAPKTDMDFRKTLFPVAVAHSIRHVAATVSMANVAVSFTHIIKSGEPAFSVLVSRLFLGEMFPTSVYLSLLPIIGGCALAAVTEINFNMIGFMGAMISNLTFVFRNIFLKKGMKGKSVSGMNYYACLSVLSLLILISFSIAVEGPQAWPAGWKTALAHIGPKRVERERERESKKREKLLAREEESGRFVFQFKSKAERDRIVGGGPWSFNGGMLILAEYNGLSLVEEVSLNHLEVWISIAGLHFSMRNNMVLGRVANGLGVFVESAYGIRKDCGFFGHEGGSSRHRR
ncbi:hypothetical protein ACLB2K_005878 [Fragaria x ananassa]